MADTDTTTTSTWLDGLEPDAVGSIQNRGWDKLPADQAARELVKAYRNLEKIQRTPADQMLRLPKQDDPQDVENFWRRLGKPEKAEEYEFGDINWDNDSDKTARFKEVARKVAAENHMPKEMAEKMVRAIFDWSDQESTQSEDAVRAKHKAEEQELYQSWGTPNSPTYRSNAFLVDRALTDLGISQDDADAIRDRIGLKPFMEMFHRIGQAMGEDKFVTTDGSYGVARGPMTREQAATALTNQKSDPQFRQKVLKGDKMAWQQMQDLIRARMAF